MRVVVVALLGVVALAAGCVGPEERSPHLQFSVQATGTTDGACDGSSAGACHPLTVTVTSANEQEPAPLGFDVWSVLDGNGASYRAATVDGPDHVDPGDTATVTVGITAPAGARFHTLRYATDVMPRPIEAPVAYPDAGT